MFTLKAYQALNVKHEGAIQAAQPSRSSRDWRDPALLNAFILTHITMQLLQMHSPAYWRMCVYTYYPD